MLPGAAPPPHPGLTLLGSQQSGAVPFAKGRCAAGASPWGVQTKLSAGTAYRAKAQMPSWQPLGPQQWGPRPPGRERRFTQHESRNIAGEPQKAFKCLFFKVVSKAGEKLSESHNEEFNSESAKRWKEAERVDSERRAFRILEERRKAREQEEKVRATSQKWLKSTFGKTVLHSASAGSLFALPGKPPPPRSWQISLCS